MASTKLQAAIFSADTSPGKTYTLSLHDALPISQAPHPRPTAYPGRPPLPGSRKKSAPPQPDPDKGGRPGRSEEHTSELQSRLHLVCRLLLGKKKEQCDRPFCYRPSPSPGTDERT